MGENKKLVTVEQLEEAARRSDERFIDEEELADAQPDWYAAEDEPGHVLNRTHYRYIANDYLFPEADLTFTEASGYAFANIPGENNEIFPGKEYTVKFAGTEYTSTATDPVAVAAMGGAECILVGNLYFAGLGANTGEPFILGYIPANEQTAIITMATGTYSVSIFGAKYAYHPLDEKFLPRPYAGKTVSGEEFVIDDETVVAGDGAEVFNDLNNNKASGSNSHAEGSDTTASGHSSHAEGNRTTASSYYAHAEGGFTTASGSYAHAEGCDTTASGPWSHAEGKDTNASVDYSHAEGRNTTVTDDSSVAPQVFTGSTKVGGHAEGNGTVVSGCFAHAEGNGTKARGDYSHAEGTATYANGNSSHAEGDNTEANGKSAHAEGYDTSAVGDYSHAEGQGTTAETSWQHVQGRYNELNGNRDIYSHIVGNGTSASARSNAHTIDWYGNAWFAGNIYVGGGGFFCLDGQNHNINGSSKLLTWDDFEDGVYQITSEDTVTDVYGDGYAYQIRVSMSTADMLKMAAHLTRFGAFGFDLSEIAGTTNVAPFVSIPGFKSMDVDGTTALVADCTILDVWHHFIITFAE